MKPLDTVAYITDEIAARPVFTSAFEHATASEAAEQALDASERHRGQIVNPVSGMAWSTRLDGCVGVLNRKSLRCLGLSQIQQSRWRLLVYPYDLDGRMWAAANEGLGSSFSSSVPVAHGAMCAGMAGSTTSGSTERVSR